MNPASHTAALLKNPVAYQPFPAKEVGRAPEGFVTGSIPVGRRKGQSAGWRHFGTRVALRGNRFGGAPPVQGEKRQRQLARTGRNRATIVAGQETASTCRYPLVINLQDVSPRFFWRGNGHVSVRVGKNVIESVITRRSAEQLGLKKGDTVTAIVKSTEVMLMKD